MIPFLHPNLDTLSAFSASELDARKHDEVGRHIRACPKCQDTLRFVHRLERALRDEPSPLAREALLDRILSSRAAGERVIVPVEAPSSAPRSRVRLSIGAGLAAATALIVAAALLSRTSELAAGSTEGALQMSPGKPAPGAAIDVSYKPAIGAFTGADSLRLRARLRTRHDQMYSVSRTQVRPVAVLRRSRDGDFRGRFTMPDSVVYAALVVEDFAATRVDDHVSRTWEVLTYLPDGRPTFDALNQRANDMMGRSWEEGYASARQMTELHPTRVESWTLRGFFERALFGEAADDSIASANKVRLDAIITQRKLEEHLDAQEIGSIYFQRYVLASKPTATKADTVELDYWWRRIQREYPRHEQVAQRLAIFGNWKALGPRAALDSLERIYQLVVPDGLRLGGRNVFNAALYQASLLGDEAVARRWRERSNAGSPDSAKALALFLAKSPRFREEGMNAIRALLAGPESVWAPPRRLSQNAAAHARDVVDERHRLLASLGRALVADGRVKAGRDTLDLASVGVWDIALFGEMETAYRAAGDLNGAARIQARIAVDPNTNETARDSISALGRRALGVTQWNQELTGARDIRRSVTLARATPRAMRAAASLQRVGEAPTLVTKLLDGKPAVVIFWSRQCGFALEALPEIADVIAKLGAQGTPVLFITDEKPSAELSRFLAEKRVTWPVYFDVAGSATAAFSNFGTPSYYVVDGSGRIWFDWVERVGDLIGQVDAIRFGATGPTRGPE